jgi:ABC-type lipoprotein release transport system permease subunit
VAAFAASRRAREVGIRMALGATDRDVTRLLVRSGARAPATGLLAGLGIGMALSVVASSVVPGVRAADPVAMSVVILAIGLLCAVALIVPVHQLLRGAPMQRLRDE